MCLSGFEGVVVAPSIKSGESLLPVGFEQAFLFIAWDVFSTMT